MAPVTSVIFSDEEDDYIETPDNIITDKIVMATNKKRCDQIYKYIKSHDCEELRNYKFPDKNFHMTLINLLIEYKQIYPSWFKSVKYLVDKCKINPFEQSYEIGYPPDNSQIVTSEMFPNRINEWKELFNINN